MTSGTDGLDVGGFDLVYTCAYTCTSCVLHLRQWNYSWKCRRGVGRVIVERCVLGEYTLTDMFLVAKDTFFGIPPDSERGTSFSIT